MLRRWWEKHSELEGLVETIRLELRRGSLSEASASISRLAIRLEEHLATEERLYFPVIERASWRNVERLESLRSSQRKVCEAIEDLGMQVENRDKVAARRALAVMLHRLYRYEVEEVDLVVESDRVASRTALTEPILH